MDGALRGTRSAPPRFPREPTDCQGCERCRALLLWGIGNRRVPSCGIRSRRSDRLRCMMQEKRCVTLRRGRLPHAGQRLDLLVGLHVRRLPQIVLGLHVEPHVRPGVERP